MSSGASERMGVAEPMHTASAPLANDWILVASAGARESGTTAV